MTYRERKQRRQRRTRSRGAVGLALLVMGVAAGAAAIAAIGYVLAVAVTSKGIGDRKVINPGATSEIFAADGSRLGFVQSDELSEPIRLREMPSVLRDATIAIEDEHFWEHGGVDYPAIVRAGIRNLAEGGTVQGGSTITQQLARTLYIENPRRTFARKVEEAKLAQQIEAEHSKEWILREYLNSIPYGTVNGRTAIGVEAAAQVFFGKQAKELKLHEAALLAGLPQAPSQYNPFQNPTAAVARRNAVIRQMADNGFISKLEASEAYRKELGAKQNDRFSTRREPYFFDYVQQLLIDRYGAEALRRGGLKVYTTIDPALQDAGRAAIATNLGYPDDPSSAVVAIDPENGDIKAMASSGTYDERTFNLAAQGHRQPGSAFKTMVLTAAILEGIDPDSTYYTSRPLNLNVPGYGPWEVKTYGNSYSGRMNLVTGTLKSDNTVYAQLIVDLGPERVKAAAQLLGITSKLKGYPAEGLGGLGQGVSPLEMANAYATLASGGIRNEPHAIERVEFANGEEEELGEPERERVMDDGQAYEVTRILRQNVSSGTGTRAQIGCADGTAGKTGTTDDFNDAWFVGYTPSLSTAVWVGFPDAQESLAGVHGIGEFAGGTIPAQIWGDFMNVANEECTSFPVPETPATLSAGDGDFATGDDDGATTTSTSPPADEPSDSPDDQPDIDPRFYEGPPAAQAPAPEGNGGQGGDGGSPGGGAGNGGSGALGRAGPVPQSGRGIGPRD